MALVTTKEMFKKAYEGGYAIGAFNINNMEIIQAITEAAGEVKSPVILQVSAGARKYAKHEYLVALAQAAIKDSGIELAATECGTCSVQITHGTGKPVVHPLTILRQRLEGTK